MNHSPNTFKYSNRLYTLNVSMYAIADDGTTSLRQSLTAGDIEQIQYSSKLNALLIDGKIVYVDQYAMVDKFLSQQYVYCNLYFAEHKKATNNEDGFGPPDPDRNVDHTFIVENIKPLMRQQHRVKYEIDLTSVNWFNCTSNLQYTNYDRAKEPIFTILKNCLSIKGLNVDNASFNASPTDVKINYITKLNDNLFTASNFLMHNLYYMPVKDDSMKFFVYDIFARKFKLIDLKSKGTLLGASCTTLSMFKTNIESLVQQEQTNFGAFVDPISKTQSYQNLFDTQMFGYSYDKNTFTQVEFSAYESRNYLNNKIDNGDYALKYHSLPEYPMMDFRHTWSYWNNDFNFYYDATSMLEQNGSFIVNMPGEILRQPGSLTEIMLDRTIANLTNDSKQELEKEKVKYKNFEGIWYNAKVENVIDTDANGSKRFRQKIVLFRNFIPKMVPRQIV